MIRSGPCERPKLLEKDNPNIQNVVTLLKVSYPMPSSFFLFFLNTYSNQVMGGFWFNRGVNPEFLKFTDRCNIWIFTLTHIKVYIFGKVMSRWIHFLHQISPKMLMLWENHKKITFLAQNFCDKLTKIILNWKWSNYWNIMLRHNFFIYSIFFLEFLIKSAKLVIFSQINV